MRRTSRRGALIALLIWSVAALAASPKASTATSGVPAAYGPTEGVASWYGAQFHGRRTSNGEIYDKEKLTCAHRSLPFGTFLLVRNLDNGASVVVRVNDRGPFAKDRVLDLSEAAARLVGMIPTGTARISFSALPSEEALAWKGGALDGAPAARPSTGPASAPGANLPHIAAATVYRIQVASYRDAANAAATVERLAAAGLSPGIEEAGPYRRVVFSGLAADQARAIAARLDTLGYRGYSVTASSSR